MATTPDDPDTEYGRVWAADYDRWEDTSTVTALVGRVVALAAGRPVLELAAGTGRLAIPLAQAGLDVTASDVSPEMVAVLRSKPGAELVRSRVESMDAVVDERRYGVVLIACNSIWMLPTAQRQVAALRSAGGLLLPGGTLLVEMGVLALPRPVGPRPVTWGPGEEGSVESWVDPATGLLVFDFVMGDGSHRVDRVRHLTVDDLRALALDAGLTVVAVEEAWTGRPPGEDAAGVVVHLR
ncbi:class I SAM-dependent methyltransferase [Klenkia sp. PcliD-1-E]|uniref:class I SAM-dependent methyltransferase n=1 Tax=Klenkia sp. PcliD-1-E TaxID=2954492 RepID=UPI0020974D97|nr:class I SAM-dependent methyltransferase [Klenkia sp. PcliD-1-E]MCO7219326.1 class I SAM-dependent methyltransferase [Klenkia sp. PcliD-1-E]